MSARGKSTENGVSLKVTSANGVDSDVFYVTVLVPDRLAFVYYSNNQDANYGYRSIIQYAIVSQLQQDLPTNITWNEHFTSNTVYDYGTTAECPNGPTGWQRGPEVASTVPPGDAEDKIQGTPYFSCPPPTYTTYQSVNGQPPAAVRGTPIHHFDGGFWVGSTTPGQGYQVQAQQWQRYINLATHNSVVSPIQ